MKKHGFSRGPRAMERIRFQPPSQEISGLEGIFHSPFAHIRKEISCSIQNLSAISLTCARQNSKRSRSWARPPIPTSFRPRTPFPPVRAKWDKATGRGTRSQSRHGGRRRAHHGHSRAGQGRLRHAAAGRRSGCRFTCASTPWASRASRSISCSTWATTSASPATFSARAPAS